MFLVRMSKVKNFPMYQTLMKSRLNYIFEEEAEYKSNHMLNKSSN
ncbi:predicted protein [Botrytis cinerea T4]|uniref:Uncharacterized protein n=1 Tax=Botryotinia fuckeliana (strain T4) TaxID=999810 RepID=G2YSC0_BOTF4|nr:predicted protein [Botrytis cinerea T4]